MSYGLGIYSIGWLTASMQTGVIALLFIILTILCYSEYQKTGKIFKHYPASVSLLFAPIYEEVIFRGFILYGLMQIYPLIIAVLISSILFGILHFKNIFYLPKKELISQMAYTGIIFGPVVALITIWSGTIWPAVILHYGNNILASYLKNNQSKINKLIK